MLPTVKCSWPDWGFGALQVADTSAKYTTVTNKGNEATPYLQYIIDNYDNLPETIVFSHGHKCACSSVTRSLHLSLQPQCRLGPA